MQAYACPFHRWEAEAGQGHTRKFQSQDSHSNLLSSSSVLCPHPYTGMIEMSPEGSLDDPRATIPVFEDTKASFRPDINVPSHSIFIFHPEV